MKRVFTRKKLRSFIIVLLFLLFIFPGRSYAEPLGPAAIGPGTITIHKHREYQENDGSYHGRSDRVGYIFYRLFEASLEFDTAGQPTGAIAYTYPGTEAQKQLINEGGYFTVDAAGNALVNPAALDPTDEHLLNADAVAWLKEHIAEIAVRVKTFGSFDTTQYGPYLYQFWDDPVVICKYLPYGYYFVDGDVGSLVMLTSTDPNAVIEDKDTSPSIDKIITSLVNADEEDHSRDIKNGFLNREAHAATVQLGDTVSYQVHVTAKKGAYRYILLDDLPTGVDLIEGTVKLYEGDPEEGTLLQEGTQYRLFASGTEEIYAQSRQRPDDLSKADLWIYQGSTEDSDLIEKILDFGAFSVWYEGNILVIFDQDYLDGFTGDTELYMTYDCLVKDTAAIACDNAGYSTLAPGNVNTARLIYGRGYSFYDKNSVYSARIRVFKHEGEGESSSLAGALNGVKFILQRDSDQAYYAQGEQGAVHWVAEKEDARVFVTGETYQGKGPQGPQSPAAGAARVGGYQGMIYIDGLTNGSYTLIETEPLPGYNAAPPQKFTVNNMNNSKGELELQANIRNKTGSLLPSTGGSGTGWFLLAGLLAVFGAGVSLLRRRMIRN